MEKRGIFGLIIVLILVLGITGCGDDEEAVVEEPVNETIKEINETTIANLTKDLQDRNLGLMMAVGFDPETGGLKRKGMKTGLLHIERDFSQFTLK